MSKYFLLILSLVCFGFYSKAQLSKYDYNHSTNILGIINHRQIMEYIKEDIAIIDDSSSNHDVVQKGSIKKIKNNPKTTNATDNKQKSNLTDSIVIQQKFVSINISSK